MYCNNDQSYFHVLLGTSATMGRRSPLKKKEKRKRQKAARKMKLNAAKFQPDGASSSQSEECISGDYEFVNDEYGFDSAVIKMRIEDDFKEQDIRDGTCTDEYSKDYLIRCREILMSKVSAYQRELAQERLEKKRLVYATEEKIQNIQNFYKKMILVPSRAGTIFKKSISSTHTAQQFLSELVTSNTVLRP